MKQIHQHNLTEVQLELVGLLQEEAAEIIQELSKVRRTGTSFCRRGGDKYTIQFVLEELEDLKMLLEISELAGLFDKCKDVADYRREKKERLKKWTNLPHSLIESI